MTDAVTGLRAHYTLPQIPPATWEENVAGRARIALDAWLAVAREHGLDVTVLEVDPPQKLAYAIVEVDGLQYVVEQHGRGGEVEARRV